MAPQHLSISAPKSPVLAQAASAAAGSVRSVQSDWLLTECGEQSSGRNVQISCTPFRIGRLPDSTLPISSQAVSKQHAELTVEGDTLWVRDMGSTNGTFVNGRRIAQPTSLAMGDLLQLANVLFRISRKRASSVMLTVQENAGDWAALLCQYDQLMNLRAVEPHFQPIIDLANRDLLGYEALARSKLPGLQQPLQMFAVAQKFADERALSELMRSEAVRRAASLSERCLLFVNTHQAELAQPAALIESIRRLRAQQPRLQLVIEIHEAAASDPQTLLAVRRELRLLGAQLAFDDFGAGQARLRELTEIAPDFVKFDMELIRGIDSADARRQATLGALVRMVADLGIVTLAEGVETDAEADTCRELGFKLGQGFLFGRPAPLQ